MKRTIIITSLLLVLSTSQAQEFTVEVDPATSELIMRKYIKLAFVESIFKMKIFPTSNPDTFFYSNPKKYRYVEDFYGVRYISELTYALGDWALKPDYKVYETNYKSPWKGYKIYLLHIPRYSPRNDSITGYEYSKPWNFSHAYNPLWIKKTVAYNPKTDDFKIADNFYRIILTHKSDGESFREKNPTYTPMYDDELKEKPVSKLPLNNDTQIVQMLKSELMKNIYANRLLKSGLLDMLTEGHYLKEGKKLFPLIDSLLPDFDDDLLMDVTFLKTDMGLVMWRFYYPGIDMVRKQGSGEYKRNRIWENFLPLQESYYVVGYSPKENRVFFISGKDIFLTRISDRFFPYFYSRDEEYRRKIDSVTFAMNRMQFLRTRFIEMESYGFTLKSSYLSEDSNYWYYNLYGETPIMKMERVADSTVSYPVYRFYDPTRPTIHVRRCYHKIRMNKENLDWVEVLEVTECDTMRQMWKYLRN